MIYIILPLSIIDIVVVVALIFKIIELKDIIRAEKEYQKYNISRSNFHKERINDI